ncbi:class I SAM-dependent methyltransferase [Goekera deserti]|uniref:class I SAM-dependent methyltransferase n=1 Tax=Goekera deserti TaxID=2497753 RepID=UPI001F3D46C9|nr:methyltransferase [Goekera deserti]
MSETLFDQLRRAPDVEAPDLVAVDATDRLLLDEAAAAVAVHPDDVAVIDDSHGALTLGAVALHGARSPRVGQDLLVGELALAANAERTGLAGSYRSHPLGPELLTGARVVLVQAPKSLAALREIAEAVAGHAAPDVTLFVGGRVKHMTRAMNDVLGDAFTDVHATLARQKSRVLVAAGPRVPAPGPTFPQCRTDGELGLQVCAHGAAFAGTKLDLGTRALLAVLPGAMPAAATAVDLGCGTGLLAAALVRSRPGLRVRASDQSTAAVASASATVAANGLAGRVDVVREDALSGLADASVDLVVCNPPFHQGTAVTNGVAERLFTAAARVLRPGGELWTVYNSHLQYRPTLTRLVGPTRQVSRDQKFTVTASARR